MKKAVKAVSTVVSKLEMDPKVIDSSSTFQCAWNIQITKTVSTKTGAKRPSPKNLVQSKLIPTCTLTKFHACGNSTCPHHTHSNSNSSVTSIWNITTNAATIGSTSSQVKFSKMRISTKMTDFRSNWNFNKTIDFRSKTEFCLKRSIFVQKWNFQKKCPNFSQKNGFWKLSNNNDL